MFKNHKPALALLSILNVDWIENYSIQLKLFYSNSKLHT